MVGATRLPAGPSVRMDPFVLRALTNPQQGMLVGRQEIASTIIDQMTHGMSAIHLIVGPSGSGRTSLLNCLAPDDSRHIGNIWNEETKTTGVIHEAVAKFTNQFQIPPTPQSAADFLRRHLDGRTGNLDLIAFDYPFIPIPDLLGIIQNIVPTLQTMRAMTVVSMRDDQYHDLGGASSIGSSFDKIHHLLPLTLEETRMLVDLRMNSVSHETILKQGGDIARLHAYTGGNPKEIVRQCGLHLAHLRFPDRHPEAPFMEQQPPFATSIPSRESHHSSSNRMGPRPEPSRPLFPSTTVLPVQTESPPSSDVYADGYDAWFADSKAIDPPSDIVNPNLIEDSLIDDDDGDDDNRPLFESIDDDSYGGIGFDPEEIHIANQDEVIDFDDSQVLYLETEEMESEGIESLDLEEESFAESYDVLPSEDHQYSLDREPMFEDLEIGIQDENEAHIRSEPIGFEPSSDFEHLESDVTPVVKPSNIRQQPRSVFFGLTDRMRENNMRMDIAPPSPPTKVIEAIDWGTNEESSNEPIPLPDVTKSSPPMEARPQMRTIDPMTSRPPDIQSKDGNAELWMDPSSVPSTPPSLTSDDELVPAPRVVKIVPSVPSLEENRSFSNTKRVIDGIHAFRKVRWEPDEPLDPTRLKTMSEADVQILTAAVEREVSPSDIALQARLQVGRSRLSQRFNDLRRTGYLSVRTEGRSRYYRLTEAASGLFSEVNQ